MSNYYKVKDEFGNVFLTLEECIRHHGGKTAPGGSTIRLVKNGKINYKGVDIYLMEYHEGDNRPPRTYKETKEPEIYTKLKQVLSEKELKAIANGESLGKAEPYPSIHLEGEHHRILVMSDTHIGSKFSPESWHEVVSGYANDPDNGIECILHLGDLVEGMKIGRMGNQIYELTHIGYIAQRDAAIRLMSMYDRPIYIISGNHDGFFAENFGCDIVQDVCNNVPNMTKVGDDQADIIVGGVKIRMLHGGDGTSYSLSYSVQKFVESFSNDNLPDIFLRGHVHKYCTLYTRGIYSLSCPALQAQSRWMRGKRIEAHTGFVVLDFETTDNKVRNISITLYPFYA